jgi:hypothetical protein
MKLASIKPVRCAIYTRVSTEHGLDQEFNSLRLTVLPGMARPMTASPKSLSGSPEPNGAVRAFLA